MKKYHISAGAQSPTTLNLTGDLPLPQLAQRDRQHAFVASHRQQGFPHVEQDALLKILAAVGGQSGQSPAVALRQRA